MNVKKSHIVLIILILAMPVYSNCQASNDSLLYWDSKIKLEWNDFRGIIPDSSEFGAASSIAIQAIPFWDGETPNVEVRTIFYPNKAWKKYPTVELLNHEQGHFDLAEIYSRKIRKAICSLHVQDYLEFDKYLEIYNVRYSEYKNASFRYDQETNYGRDNGGQTQWNGNILLQLEGLEKYKYKKDN